jgi:hypothetical protein
MDFIERIFGMSPDGGSGSFEFMLFAIPIAGILDRRFHGMVVRWVGRRIARADDAVLVVQMLVLRLRMHDARFGVVRVELDHMRLAVVDPDDTVKMAHGSCLTATRRFSIGAAALPGDPADARYTTRLCPGRSRRYDRAR